MFIHRGGTLAGHNVLGPYIHRRRIIAIPFIFLVATMLLAACGGAGTQQAQKQAVTPTPTPGQGQQLLNKAAQNLNTAKTLHGIFDLVISGQIFNGTVKTEVWNASPDKNRTVVLQSTVTRFPTGSITVFNGKQLWQYDPVKKVVYTGPSSSGSGAGTPPATPSANGSNAGGNQVVSILNLVQSVFTRSNATLVSSTASVNGIETYELHVTPQSAAASGVGGSRNFNYDGDVYLNKSTTLPMRVNLMIQGIGQVTLDLPSLVLNQSLENNLFTFVPPAGVKVLPLQQESNPTDTGSITLAQAEQQAGYHLFSIPASETGYQLLGVDALGAPGNQIYALNYTMGSTTFTISEGKPLANLPVSGQPVSLGRTTATLSSSNGSSTLTWTENGTGIQITGKLSNQQIEAIAKLLS
jgi:outer membrane lipoprotein-sorting protein